MMKVERYWIGRSFCYSKIEGEKGSVNGYVWYGSRKPKKDSGLHEKIDFLVRRILKKVTGRTTGVAEVQDEVVKQEITELLKDCYNHGITSRRSWRVGEMVRML